MKKTQPRVYCIAETYLAVSVVREWLESIGVYDIPDRSVGLGSEGLVRLAAKRCYKSFEVGLNENVTAVRQDNAKFIENLLSSGHGSPFEHASATFAFEGVSRVFTHELVRHRAGCAYSQESLRFVRLKEMQMWFPPVVEQSQELRELFHETAEFLEKQQRRLEVLTGVNHPQLAFKRKKELTSMFRRIAPMGLATGIVATFNLRALRHVIAMRTSEAAEVEMRIVFDMVAQICRERWPLLFLDMAPIPVDKGDSPPVWQFGYQKV